MFRADLDAMDDVVRRLRATHDELDELGALLDQRIGVLHEHWDGAAAGGHADAHAHWDRGFALMRAAPVPHDFLRKVLASRYPTLCVMVDEGLAPLAALTQAKDRRLAVSPSESQYGGWAGWLRRHGHPVPSFHDFGCIAYRHLA